MKTIRTVILAAGAGTRMKSETAKVLHKAAGKTLLAHVIDAAKGAGSHDIAVIVGHQGESVRASLPEDVAVYEQKEQLGTGHALMQAAPFFEDADASVLVLCGDAPLVRPETLEALVREHETAGNAVTVLTAEFEDPTGYGRIITKDGALVKIVEQKDATPEEQAVRTINSGVYCFDGRALSDALRHIGADNAQHEYYLTDAVGIIRESGLRAGTCPTDDPEDIAAVNSRAQLAEVSAIFKKRINARHMKDGVTFIDPAATYVDADVTIGPDTILYPGAVIEGKTAIGKNCVIGPGSHLVDAKVGDGAVIEASAVRRAGVPAGMTVGPYTLFGEAEE